jgi:hypothetical protein
MAGALPHYKLGPANYIAAGLVLGGQLVSAAGTLTGTLTNLSNTAVVPSAAGDAIVLGVAATDANVGKLPVDPSTGDYAFPTGATGPDGGVSLPAGWAGDGSVTTQDELLDQSILDYTVAVYNNVDIRVNYAATATFGQLLMAGASGSVTPFTGTNYSLIVGRCTEPGGVTVSSGTVAGRAFIRV